MWKSIILANKANDLYLFSNLAQLLKQLNFKNLFTVAEAQLTEYRCGAEGCNKLLFKGSFEGVIERKCKCGKVNRFEAFRPLSKEEEERIRREFNKKPFQQRMGIHTKD